MKEEFLFILFSGRGLHIGVQLEAKVSIPSNNKMKDEDLIKIERHIYKMTVTLKCRGSNKLSIILTPIILSVT